MVNVYAGKEPIFAYKDLSLLTATIVVLLNTCSLLAFIAIKARPLLLQIMCVQQQEVLYKGRTQHLALMSSLSSKRVLSYHPSDKLAKYVTTGY